MEEQSKPKSPKLEVLLKNVVSFGRGFVVGGAMGLVLREELLPNSLVAEVGMSYAVEQGMNLFLLTYPRLNYDFVKRYQEAMLDDPGAVTGMVAGYHFARSLTR